MVVRLIVGLGNPGERYANTRHNLGYMVVDRISKTLLIKPIEATRLYRLYEGKRNNERVLCLYPLTYMNRSGIAVEEVVQRYHLETKEIIIILDDLNLPLGSIRIRPGGSAGGHNGLTSVIHSLGTEEIPRVRLGIYNEHAFSKYADAAEFVLSEFESDEQPIVTNMLQSAHDATLMMVDEGITNAMNRYNRTVDATNPYTRTKDTE